MLPDDVDGGNVATHLSDLVVGEQAVPGGRAVHSDGDDGPSLYLLSDQSAEWVLNQS